MAKPVIKVYLLPHDLDEEELQALHQQLVKATKLVSALGVGSENDLIVIFPVDLMKKGLGEEILAEVDVPDAPVITAEVEGLVASAVRSALGRQFPGAYIQCKVYRFDCVRGFRSRPPQG